MHFETNSDLPGMPVTLQSENLSMSREHSLATKLNRQIQVIVVKVPLCSVSRVDDRLNLYFDYPEKGTGKNEKTHDIRYTLPSSAAWHLPWRSIYYGNQVS